MLTQWPKQNAMPDCCLNATSAISLWSFTSPCLLHALQMFLQSHYFQSCSHMASALPGTSAPPASQEHCWPLGSEEITPCCDNFVTFLGLLMDRLLTELLKNIPALTHISPKPPVAPPLCFQKTNPSFSSAGSPHGRKGPNPPRASPC